MAAKGGRIDFMFLGPLTQPHDPLLVGVTRGVGATLQTRHLPPPPPPMTRHLTPPPPRTSHLLPPPGPDTYAPLRSMRGRYASYWNAFLLDLALYRLHLHMRYFIQQIYLLPGMAAGETPKTNQYFYVKSTGIKEKVLRGLGT